LSAAVPLDCDEGLIPSGIHVPETPMSEAWCMMWSGRKHPAG
jgi:hypothetical protein